MFVNILLPTWSVQTFTLSLSELSAADANSVYSILLGVLHEFSIPMRKVIGICSDGASTMQGVHKGVCTQLARYIRQVREVDIAALLEENPRRGRDSNSCKLIPTGSTVVLCSPQAPLPLTTTTSLSAHALCPLLPNLHILWSPAPTPDAKPREGTSRYNKTRQVRTLAVYCYSSTAVHLAVQFCCCLCQLEK